MKEKDIIVKCCGVKQGYPAQLMKGETEMRCKWCNRLFWTRELGIIEPKRSDSKQLKRALISIGVLVGVAVLKAYGEK